MFSESIKNEELLEILLSSDEFKPYPDIEEREPWDSLPGAIRISTISEGEKYMGFTWPDLTASMYMEFYNNGNRTCYDLPYHQKRRALASLVLAECMENRGRFINDIINGIWCICEESSWVISAHNHMSGNAKNVSAHEHDVNRKEALLPDIERPFIDLFAAETSNLLSWTYYLVKKALDKVTPLICRRIHLEIRRRILTPYLNHRDFWWMGFDRNRSVNNWTTWCTSNCLSTFFIMEDNRENRAKAVQKALFSLDRFIGTYHDDGGCDEGPGYWNKAGGSLFDCLELLYIASRGRINFYDQPIVKNIGAYIYKAYINNEYFLNFSDNAHKIFIEGDLVYRYGERTGDYNLKAIGWCFHKKLGAESTKKMKFFSPLRILPAIFNYEKLENESYQMAFEKNILMDGIQIMVAREKEKTDEGLCLALKGGHNAESHNHNDVGHFVVYANGQPIFVDVGVETYSAKTFSQERYTIWTMKSSYHNLPDINGIPQKPGKESQAAILAYHADDNTTALSLDITAAYPEETGILSWVRNYTMERTPRPYIRVSEDFSFKQAAGGHDFQLNYMTCINPVIVNEDRIKLVANDSTSVYMHFDSGSFSPSIEEIEIEDSKLKNEWGDRLYRIVLKPKNLVSEGTYEVRFSSEE